MTDRVAELRADAREFIRGGMESLRRLSSAPDDEREGLLAHLASLPWIISYVRWMIELELEDAA